MVLPLLVFSILFALLVTDIFSPKQQKKRTPEQELGDAIAKYLAKSPKK